MTAETSSPSAAKPAKRGWHLWLLLLVLLLAVAAGVVAWRQLHLAQQQLDLKLTQAEAQQQAQSTRWQQQQQALSTQLQSVQDSAALQRQKLALLGEGGTRLWLLNEAKTLASLAQQRLLLTADLPAALQLLTASDKVLTHIDDPRVLPARRALAQDMQKLRAAQQLDTTGILLQLGALLTQLQQLTLPEASDKSDKHTTPATSSKTSGWWQRLLSRLPLTIQRSDVALPLPLAPAQLAQARLSLSMNLQQAQLAILQGRAKVYRQALAQTEATLNTYFSAQDANVKSLHASLAKLEKVQINQALPQIGAGLDAIAALLDPQPAAQGD